MALALDAAEGHVGVELLVVGAMIDLGQHVDGRSLHIEKRLQVGTGHSGPDHARPHRRREGARPFTSISNGSIAVALEATTWQIAFRSLLGISPRKASVR